MTVAYTTATTTVYTYASVDAAFKAAHAARQQAVWEGNSVASKAWSTHLNVLRKLTVV